MAAELNRRTISEEELRETLMARASSIRTYLGSKIPLKLQGIVTPEDVLQDIWIAAFRGLSGFRITGADALDRWLSSITQRELVDAIKTAQRVKRGGRHLILQGNGGILSSAMNLFSRVASTQKTPSSEAAAAEAAEAVRSALDSLPEQRRQAIWMRHIEGKPCDEIATAMHKTKPAVNSLLFHGLRQLHRRLGKSGKFLSDAPTTEDEPPK